MGERVQIRKDEKGIQTLLVDGKPYLLLGGELHNSSASSLSYMEEEVWPYIRELGLNTILLPITWEGIEPKEDKFDFQILEGLLEQARREGVKLILLWFGLWKNGESTYVPVWVKKDTKRFFRAAYSEGKPSQTISPLCQAAVNADAKAFSHFMAKLKELDQSEHTVLMVQVENEIGFLGADRDYSSFANQSYEILIPERVTEEYKKEGSWGQAFGEDAPEMFMAYHYAEAVEVIARAGKEIYDLPLYVNAWLNQFPDRPGNYPSGGPITRNMQMWKCVAGHIDVFAPDIYLSDFAGVCEEYVQMENPLLIPEARRDPVTASNAFYAFGQHFALGFSPFGIEDFLKPSVEVPDERLLSELNIDAAAFTCIQTGNYLKETYRVLKELEPLYYECRGTSRLMAFMKKSEHERGCILPLATCDLELTYCPKGIQKPGCAGIVIEKVDGEFWIAGCNVEIRLIPKKGRADCITLAVLEEGGFVDGEWKAGRVLNGDERALSKLGAYAEIKHFIYCTSDH